MDLHLTDSQKLLVESAQRFFDRSYPLEKMREIYLLQEKPDPRLWQDMSELGWNAAAFPEEVGGFEGGLVEAMLLLIEMGRNACATPYPHSTIAAGLALHAAGHDLSSAIAASEAVVIPVPAQLQDEEPVFANGKLSIATLPVAWADQATHFLVEAGPRALLLPAGQPQIALEPLLTTRGEPLFHLTCKAADAQDIGSAPQIFAVLRSYGAFACAALLLGMAERSLELAADYAKERERQAFALAASRAKSWMADNARKVTRDAMQIFGGVSFCGDHPIQMYYQFVITLANHYGLAHAHRESVAAALLGEA